MKTEKVKQMSERKQRGWMKKQQRKQLPLKKKVLRYLLMAVSCIVIIIIMLATLGTVVQATGLVDETVDVANLYSKYPLDNYQLDFYVNNDWAWLPWNWGEGIGKSVNYGLYAITNFIWTISLYFSNATGYLIQEAYKLDFIDQTANAIGTNIQTIAGVTKTGFSSSGFYVGFLLILILILGVYVTYTGLIKRETTKAIKALMNFVVVFVLSASFIAYAPDYITKINEFSKDISTASLDIGTKIILPNSDSKGKDSVDFIRNALFSIQVEQPWLLLQYGNSDKSELGEERVEKLVSTSPDLNDGDDREKIVIDEIEKQNNNHLTITKTINRLGTVFFLFFFNIGISIFVFILTGIMIFSQVLFIIYAMFLPVSFLMSMIPSFEGTSKRAIMKFFNTIMAKVGITLIITVAFSISTMFYTLSAGSPFFLIAFLQIVTFAGIYFRLGDLMSLFALQSNDSQSTARSVMCRPYSSFRRNTRMMQQRFMRTIAKSQQKSKGGKSGKKNKKEPNSTNHNRSDTTHPASSKRPQSDVAEPPVSKSENGTDVKNKKPNRPTIYKRNQKSTAHTGENSSTATNGVRSSRNRQTAGQRRANVDEKADNKRWSRKQVEPTTSMTNRQAKQSRPTVSAINAKRGRKK